MDRQHYFGDICIPRRAFISEHVSLIDTLKHGSRAKQLKEAEDQASELKKETGGGRNSGYIQRLIGKKERFSIGKMKVDDARGLPSKWIKERYGEKAAPEKPKYSRWQSFLEEDISIPEVGKMLRAYKMDPNAPRLKRKLLDAWERFEEFAEGRGVKAEATKHIYGKFPGLSEAISAESFRGKLPPLSSFAQRLRS